MVLVDQIAGREDLETPEDDHAGVWSIGFQAEEFGRRRGRGVRVSHKSPPEPRLAKNSLGLPDHMFSWLRSGHLGE